MRNYKVLESLSSRFDWIFFATKRTPEYSRDYSSPCYNFLYRKSAATPFFDHVSGKILIKGGKVVNDDGVQDADVLVDTAEGTIVAIGTDLEVSGDCKVIMKIYIILKT